MIRIDEDTFVGTIARLLKKYRIKRVPVTRLGAIVGIVSRSNLLHALSAIAGGALPEPSQDDRDLRARIETALKEVPDITVSLVNFTVEDGHVSV
ncbi:MAG TPA: CBS domain-containing protein [Roseovarius sp.]|uniref:CBS domain-containing protein n=1 Tax=Roseovarius sp. M141 TaxID=2583806 RepID=UPI0020CF3211